MSHFSIKFTLLLLMSTAMLIAGLTITVVAQTANSPWTTPVNLSRAGAGSQPVIVVSPDGTLHALWWDAIDGIQYARTTGSVTSTTWTDPVAVSAIVGARSLDAATRQETLSAPSQLQMLADARGNVHAFWRNASGSLQNAQTSGANWSSAITLTQSFGAMAVTADMSSTLHLAYTKRSKDTDGPAGVYYRTSQGARWSAPKLIYASPYFRTAIPEQTHVSTAGDRQGHVLAVWNDPQLGQSLYARSADDGSTWGAPQAITSTQGARIQDAYVAATPSNEFLMVWRNPETGGCGYVQSLSSDGGLTWSAPAKVLSGLTRCEEKLSFMPDANGLLWLIGHLDSTTETSRDRVSLAKWDGGRWSDPIDVAQTFIDPGTNRTITLNCLSVAIAGQTAGLSGCDSTQDVWTARNAVTLDQLIALEQPVWSPVVALSDSSVSAAEHDTPALIADSQGNFLALWSQEPASGSGTLELYGATSNGTRWSRPAALMRASDGSTPNVSPMQEPALSIDEQSRVHAVWSIGTNGSVQYSSAFARDFASPQAWSPPISLPTPDNLTSWPDIVADRRGGLVYVVYAVPFNEKRGIYVVRSQDSGTTWLTPTLVFDAAAAQWTNVDKPRLALDATSNILHAAWLHTVPTGGVGPQAIYYARSTDQGATWSEPVKVAEGNVDWPRLAVPDTEKVYLAWTEVSGAGQAGSATPLAVRGQFSPDGGQHWSATSGVSGFEQVSGPIGLTTGGEGQMHLAAIGQGAGQEAVLLNAQWNGQAWEMREPLPLGQHAAVKNSASIAVSPTKGKLTAVLRLRSLGQSQIDRIGIISTGRQITGTQLIPAPTFTPAPTVTAMPKPTSTPQPTPRPAINTDTNSSSAGNSGSSPLIAGGVLAAIIVVAAFVVVVWRQRRQHG
jgi:hypothetical protein